MSNEEIWVDGAQRASSTLIFINYRSSDEHYAALVLDKRLTERFGGGRVFRDSRTIRPGTYFPAEIERALRDCQAMIVVIGERWLRTDVDGRKLIDYPDDYVRMEIAEGIRRNILVIPVLVDDASLPPVSALPVNIAELARRQHLHMRFRSADHDASRLVDELVDRFDGTGLRAPYPARPREPQAVREPMTRSLPGSVTFNQFNDSVDARYANFGNVYNY